MRFWLFRVGPTRPAARRGTSGPTRSPHETHGEEPPATSGRALADRTPESTRLDDEGDEAEACTRAPGVGPLYRLNERRLALALVDSPVPPRSKER
jgi:hypothetical protein